MAQGNRDKIIQIENLTKIFEPDLVALQKITLNVSPGEFLCLLGPSGCGKSTLLNLIAGFLTPTTGTILVEGKPISAPGPDRGVVFQEYALFPWMTVEENVAFGLRIKKTAPQEIKEKVADLLQMLHLYDFREHFPKDLSGGMLQRVAIARVLAIDPPILLMDEPFGALDALTRRTLQDELLRLFTTFRKTIVFVTHSIEESIYLADRTLVMTYRPGTIKKEFPINLPRPRDSTSPAFNLLKKEIEALITEEQKRLIEEDLTEHPQSGYNEKKGCEYD